MNASKLAKGFSLDDGCALPPHAAELGCRLSLAGILPPSRDIKTAARSPVPYFGGRASVMLLAVASNLAIHVSK